ncbi:MAG: DEAD/DEAH box helicase [Verrucomicrobiota bacterium]
MSFQNLGLDPRIVHAVQRLRFVDPSPIQAQAIPVILKERDLLASAQTGTGKTAAFLLPLLSKLKEPGNTRAVVLEPTRELAAQVNDALKDFTAFSHLSYCLLHGGVKYEPQLAALKRSPDIIVATPGRFIDHLESGALDLKNVSHLVLDEADRMLDMGFLPDVTRIIDACPKERQTLLFSATLPPAIQNLISWAMKDPEKVQIDIQVSKAETVDHALYPVASDQKFELLLALLDHVDYNGVIVFTRTKVEADKIAHALEETDHSVTTLHSDRSQSQRTKALEKFKSRECEVLIATNIAARGIDIAGVSHVINYDIPENPEDYIHRIGRTGRASTTGDALTLLTGFDEDHLKAIETLLKSEIPRKKLEGFNYKYTALLNPTSAKPIRRRGGSPSRRRK